ncbi:MAG: FecR domain-containing protein, partial [Burkholderiales bacterium]
MISTISGNRIIALLFGITAMTMSGMVMADPPTRVARLGFSYGAVSYSPAGENDWVEAPVNLPLAAGDRLWADAGARDELQIGNAVIRMDANTSVTLLNMDDRVAQLQLSQGTVNVHVRRLGPDDVVEIDTPNLAFSVREPGNYRIDVDPDGNATTVTVRNGQGEADSEGAAYVVDARQSVRFAGTGLQDYQSQALAPAEEFDRWAADRDRRVDHSVSARYVSRDM